MPDITCEERQGMRRGRVGVRNDGEQHYTVQGTEDENEVVAQVLAMAPASKNGAPLQFIDYVEICDGLWHATAIYDQNALIDLTKDDMSFTFDTGGGTTKVYTALEEVAFYNSAGKIAGATYNGAIEASNDGTVAGTDIVTPQYQFEITKIYPNEQVNDTFKRHLIVNTGRMNAASFKGLLRGECLFLGAAGGVRGNEEWSITQRFAGQPNVTAADPLHIGDVTVPDKLGWDYLWVKYEQADNAFGTNGPKLLIPKPKFVAIDRVYRFGNFGNLAVGT